MNKLMIGLFCMAALTQVVQAEETPVTDAGVQAVMAAQQTTVHPTAEARTAKEKVIQELDKAFGKGKWRAKRADRKITVVELTYAMENAATEKEFFVIRDLLAKRALMQAKVQLAESMSATAEAADDFEVKPGDVVTKEFRTAMTLAATHPQTVFGATILNQAESYSDGVYRLAVAVVWSENLKKAAVEFLDPPKAVKASADKNADYLADWVGRQDFRMMCGPRQVMTPDGERIFIGISAREIGKNAEASENNVRLAQLYAIQAMLYSLYADVTFSDAANSVLKQETAGGVDGITQGAAVETLERHISLRAKKVLRGLDEIYGEEMEHPITKRKMHVSVYALSASQAAAAKALSVDIAACRARVARADSADRAFDQGLQDAINTAAADGSSAEKARKNGKTAVEAKENPAGLLPNGGRATSPKPPEKKAQEGVFGGNETINTGIL